MSAVVFREERAQQITTQQAELRRTLGRQPGQVLHWRKIKTPEQKLVAANALNNMPIAVLSVVVCKRQFETNLPSDHVAYLYTFRLLLERLSWLAKRNSVKLNLTLSHVTRFKLDQLREYEHRLQTTTTSIEWEFLRPVAIDQPRRVESLQLADMAASATFAAFEADSGLPDRRFLEAFASRLWRGGNRSKLHSYGLKVHPWNRDTSSRLSWIDEL